MALRKTSHDGADSTSITSGIENEIKKAGSNINKIKKSSIKRKVQNFSHESDDGIIEPLLQTDKEKSDIANRSAKFLLYKSKTDASYEKDNKFGEDFADKCSVSSPVQQANELLSNNLKETPASTPYICEMAPIHNYMNTNIFSTYDVTKVITTKSPILVEIDGSKPGIYSPSPLIFTTAKIHTDSKTKLMEPLQVTPVPILSTIEGSVIRARGTSETDKINSFTQQPRDLIKSTFDKSDISEVRSIKDKQTTATTPTSISSNIEVVSSKVEPNITDNQIISPNESVLVNSFVKCTGFVDKSQVHGQLANNTSTAGTTALLSNLNEVEQVASISNFKLKDYSSNIVNSTETSKANNTFKSLSDKSVSEDKNTENITNNDDYQFSSKHQQKLGSFKSATLPSEIKDSTITKNKISYIKSLSTKNQEIVQGNTGNSEKSLTASKKLQRQKNSFPQEILQDVATISKVSTTDKSSENLGKDKKSAPETENPISIKESHKIEGAIAQKLKVNSTYPSDKSPTPIVTTCNDATSTIISSIDSSPNTTTILSLTSNVKSVKPVVVLDSKTSVHLIDTAKLTSETSIVTSVSNSKNVFQLSSTTSIKTPPLESLANQSIQAIPVSSKPDFANSLTPLSYKQSNVAEVSLTSSSPAVTTLPAYIVSTSKTKIGSTFTITSTSTTKSHTSSPLTETVYTKTAPIKSSGAQQSARPTVGLSPTNGTKHPNFSRQTKSDKIIKDGRA